MVGPEIKQARLERGLGLRQLARLAEIAPSFLVRIERGDANPSLKTLGRLAEALGHEPVKLALGQSHPDLARARSDFAPLARDSERLLRTVADLEPRQRRLILAIAEELAERTGTRRGTSGRPTRERAK